MAGKRKWLFAVFCIFIASLFMKSKGAEAAGSATMLPDSAIMIDYEYENAVVTAGKNTIIYYSDNPNAVNWEEAYVNSSGKAIFDISFLRPGTTTRIYIKGDVDGIVTARYIYAQQKLVADFVGDVTAADIVDIEQWKKVYQSYPSFSGRTGYFLFFLKDGSAETAFFELDRIEWKKGTTGNWQPFSALDLSQMNARGATLYFRIKSVNDAATADKKSGMRYSAEAKVFLQKTAVAPTVSVNVATMSISLRNGLEYSLNQKDWFLIPSYYKDATLNSVAIPVTDFSVLPTTNQRVNTVAVQLVLGIGANEKIDASLVAKNPSKYQVRREDSGEASGIYLYVRTAASVQKAASRISTIVVPFSKTTPNVAKDIGVTYQNTKQGESGIILTNRTTTENPVDYQYTFVDHPDTLTAEELSLLKWNALKAAKTVKVSSSKALTGQYVIFRVAASGKGELPSNYEKYAYQILYDKVTFALLASTSFYPGGVVTATTSNNQIYGEITYTWQRCNMINGTYTDITSGKGYENSKYTIKDSDIGYYIRVKISNVSMTGEKAEVISKSTGKIAKDPSAPNP